MSSSDKLADIFVCWLCKEKYNETEKKPTTLFPCGHTLCSICIDKLSKGRCLICSQEYERSVTNLALIPKQKSTLPQVDFHKTKENLVKTKELRKEFITAYKQEIEQKNTYFEVLRKNLKAKTDESIRKVRENEARIKQQILILEKKLEQMFSNCSEFEKNLENRLSNWEPALEDAKNQNEKLNEFNLKIEFELLNLNEIVTKLKPSSFEKNINNLNEASNVDDLFLIRLMDANNILENYNLECKILNNNNNNYINANNNTNKISSSNNTIKTYDSNDSITSINTNSQSSSKKIDTLNIEFMCFKCGLELAGTYTVYNEKKYHAQCFVCGKCKHEIVENTFYNLNNAPLCRICYNVNLVENASICFKCSQPILDTLITYKGNEYHDYCLTCYSCDKSLMGISIYSDDKRNPHCIECFTKKEGKMCSICKDHIVPSQTSFYFDQKNFHKECFKCKRCTRQINSDEVFFKSKEAVNEFICSDCAKK